MTLPENALRQDNDTDYTLNENHYCVWITVENISVCVKRTDEGVVVDLYPKEGEHDETIATTYAFDNEGVTP